MYDSRVWARGENHVTISPDLYIYRRSATFFNDVVAAARNSSDFDRTADGRDFHSARAQMVSSNFRRITRRRSAAADTVYKLVRNWQYVSPIRLSSFGGHFRECAPPVPAMPLLSDIFADRSFRESHVCERQIWYYGNLISSNSTGLRYRLRSDRRPRSDCSRISASSPANNWNSLLFSIPGRIMVFFKSEKMFLRRRELSFQELSRWRTEKKLERMLNCKATKIAKCWYKF